MRRGGDHLEGLLFALLKGGEGGLRKLCGEGQYKLQLVKSDKKINLYDNRMASIKVSLGLGE